MDDIDAFGSTLTDEQIWQDALPGRRESALFLYNYLIKNPDIRVLNVNSAWGTGKSFFLERWHRDLQRNHVCVTFNAWKNDFAVEPLIALAGAIKNQLQEQDPVARQKMQGFLRRTASTIKAASPAVIKGLLNKLGGLDTDEISDAIKAAAECSADAAEKALEHLLEKQEPAEQTIEDFKAALQAVFDDYKQRHNGVQDDVFIIIDELDRCRPTFAIELLERVKHFFDLPNCRFIIASDTEQLQHSIRSIYGEGFDSRTYLRRFFDANFSLNKPSYSSFIARHLNPESESLSYIQPQAGITTQVALLDSLAQSFDINLRDLERCINRINACQASLHPQLPLTAYLVFLRETRPEHYPLPVHKRPLWQHLGGFRLRIAPLHTQLSAPLNSALGICQAFLEGSEKSQHEINQAIRGSNDQSLTYLVPIFNNWAKVERCKSLVELSAQLD